MSCLLLVMTGLLMYPNFDANDLSSAGMLHSDIKVLGSICPSSNISNIKMKRNAEECVNQEVKKPKGNWSLGLLESINDPNLLVRKSDNIAIIKDKYPKAKYHFLVIPEDDIGSIFKLTRSHIELLERFGKIFEELKVEICDGKLRAGFHAVPSMHRLHMHILSQDMVSPCLKTKVHWNSFTTNFFIPYQQILEELKEKGTITRISEEKHKALLATPLKCNRCDFIPKNMPQLKEHLLVHL